VEIACKNISTIKILRKATFRSGENRERVEFLPTVNSRGGISFCVLPLVGEIHAATEERGKGPLFILIKLWLAERVPIRMQLFGSYLALRFGSLDPRIGSLFGGLRFCIDR